MYGTDKKTDSTQGIINEYSSGQVSRLAHLSQQHAKTRD